MMYVCESHRSNPSTWNPFTRVRLGCISEYYQCSGTLSVKGQTVVFTVDSITSFWGNKPTGIWEVQELSETLSIMNTFVFFAHAEW